MFCCGVLPGLTMSVLVWDKENSYFWKTHSLGMYFGQDPVSMNVPKAKILMDSCEEQDWVLLLHPWRITLSHMCPLGEGWLGQERAGTCACCLHGTVFCWDARQAWIAWALKGISITSLSPHFPFIKLSKALKAHGQYCQSWQHSKAMTQILMNHSAGRNITSWNIYLPV